MQYICIINRFYPGYSLSMSFNLHFPVPSKPFSQRTVQTAHHPLVFSSLVLSCGSYVYFFWLFCSMAFHQHLINVVIGVPFTGLMNGIRSFSQCHCCHTIILRYNNISLSADTDQLIIHCIRSGSDNNNLAVTR